MDQQLLDLAAIHVNGYKQKVNAKMQTMSILQNEQTIMEDIECSLVNPMKASQKINNINKELKKIDNDILEARKYLLALQKKEKQTHKGASDMIKMLIPLYQEALTQECLMACSKGHSDVLITNIIELEDRILTMTEKLDQRGLFPETQEERLTRVRSVLEHKEKVVGFIKIAMTSK